MSRGRPRKKKEEEIIEDLVDDSLEDDIKEEKIKELTQLIIQKTEVRSMGSMTTAKEKRMIRAIVEVIVG